MDTYDIRKNLIYLPLIEELESFKIIQTQETESLQRTTTKRFFERQSTLRPQTANRQKEGEQFYENYWDMKLFCENGDSSIESQNMESTEEHKILMDEITKTAKDTNENFSNQFLRVHNDEDQLSDFPTKSDKNIITPHPKILEFLGETESKNIDPSSRDSLNSPDGPSPLRGFSLLKHSLLHNIYKSTSILKVRPVPIDNSGSKHEEARDSKEIRDFNKMFESQERKISELRKKDPFRDLNVSQVSSNVLSNVQSPEKRPKNNVSFKKFFKTTIFFLRVPRKTLKA